MRVAIILLLVAVGITGCTNHRSTLTDELAVQLHMRPFALNGGQELGSIVVLDEDGFPQFLAGKETLTRKVRTIPNPLPLPASSFDRTALLTASASANPIIANSPKVKSDLSDLESFTLRIEQWSKKFIQEGPMAFERWLSDSSAESRSERLQAIRNLERLADNHDIYYIYEVIEVQQGGYHAKWKTKLSGEAQAQVIQALSIAGVFNSNNDQEATVKISQPLSVAYSAHRFKLSRLREATQPNIQ